MSFSRVLILLFLVGLFSAPKTFAAEDQSDLNNQKPKSKINFVLTGTGLALMAGGGTLAYFQNRAANQDMAIYRKSAFTENTTDYRERVHEHERWTWVGLAGAVLGGVLVVVSF